MRAMRCGVPYAAQIPFFVTATPAAVCGWFSSAVGFGSAIRAGAPGARGSIRRTLVPSESEAQIEPYPNAGATWLGFSPAIAARPRIAPVVGSIVASRPPSRSRP